MATSADRTDCEMSASYHYEELPEAPTYYPTPKEFADCLGYLRKIASEASQFGICRIVPPKEWNPDYSFPFDSPFPVRKQVLTHRKLVSRGSGNCANMKVYAKVDMEARDPKTLRQLLNHDQDLKRKYSKTVLGMPSATGASNAIPSSATSGASKSGASTIVDQIPTSDPLAVEYLYWKWFCGSGKRVTWYASDVEGSAFPCSDQQNEQEFGKDWNLRNIARLEGGGFLKFMNDVVPGVTDPMLYIAVLFSTFCWHYEDNFLYSVSYNHDGADRTWYGVSGNHFVDFENVAMEQILPDKFRDEDHIRLKTTMFSPGFLIENGVPVYKVIQRPRDFIFTFPGAYHSGFSHGFSVSESVNFALPDWLPWGRISVDLYTRVLRIPVIPYQEVTIRAAQHISSTKEAFPQAIFVVEALEQLLEEELSARSQFLLSGIEARRISSRWIEYCPICRHAICISFFTCGCDPTHHFCLRHFKDHQLCYAKGFREIHLMIKYTIEELKGLLHGSRKVIDRQQPT